MRRSFYRKATPEEIAATLPAAVLPSVDFVKLPSGETVGVTTGARAPAKKKIAGKKKTR